MGRRESGPLVSVVLPTYNERDNVAPLVRELRASLAWPGEFLVVDDDSPDGTAQVVRDLAREIDGIRLILRRRERGLVSAIQRGIDEAEGQVVVWMDCDCSMPPERVRALVSEVVDGADAAIGSRYVEGGFSQPGAHDPALVRVQRFLTRHLNRAAARWTGVAFHDWTSGFVAVRAPLIKEVRLRGVYGEYFISLVAELVGRGARVVELPYRCLPRERGESKTARGTLGFARLGTRYLRALLAARRRVRSAGRVARRAPGN